MNRSGDCEDYSIAKYFALRKLGFAKEELRVVILLDKIRGIGHAVLALYAKDEILILDSLSNLILPHSRYKHYVPQYSMNETTRWAHIGGAKRKKSTVYQGLLAKKPK
jgi:predicted transglutaminase-like cysteine proteinase